MWLRVFIMSFGLYAFSATAIEFKECADIKDAGSYVASQTNCSKYIYCDGVNSFEGICFEDNYYDAEQERCTDRNAVKCKQSGDVNQVINNEIQSGKVPAFNQIKVTVPVSVNVGNQVTSMLSGQPKENFNVAAATTTTMTLPLVQQPQEFACPAAAATDPSSVISISDGMPFQLPNPASCSSYYLCYNGVSISMSCTLGMHFNRQSGRCAPAETVPCVTPTQPFVRSVCRVGVYGYLPHRYKCEYFYYCSNGYQLIHRCPYTYTWHYERRTCVHHTQAKCYNNDIVGGDLL